MILQALTRYYEDLLTRGEIAAPGWSPAKISFALCLDENGAVIQVIPTMQEVVAGKKTVQRPQEIVLPAAVKRTAGVASNFLWDNSAYLLGIDQKGKPARSRECFQAAAQLHHAILDGVESPAARAILAFFDTWDPSMAVEHPALRASFDEITGSANLAFRVDGVYPQDDPAIRAAWQTHRDGGDPNAVRLQCLVTGREDEISATHPAIKGVRDAQSSGAALVSFNAPAFCSYGREQNYNAPVGKHAAFAYTAALNHLLADKSRVQTIGDTTVVCWAEGAEPVYQDYAQAFLFGGETPKGLSDNDLCAALKRLADGKPCDDLGVDPNRPFYILGLARDGKPQLPRQIAGPRNGGRDGAHRLLRRAVSGGTAGGRDAPHPRRAERHMGPSGHLKSVLPEQSTYRLPEGGFDRESQRSQHQPGLYAGPPVLGLRGRAAGRKSRHQRNDQG